MRSQPDIVVYSPEKRLQMVVEVKFRRGASTEWAQQFRRNLLAHHFIPHASYFLLVLPEQSYLWRNGEQQSEAAPDYAVPTDEIIKSFFPAPASTPSDEQSLELAVRAWLDSVTTMRKDDVAQRHAWLVQSGVFDQIRGGHVEYRPAA